MNKKICFAGVGAMLLLGACTTGSDEYVVIEPASENEIRLQNPKNREIIACRDSAVDSAENCARIFEMNGFVRLTDIPQQIAKYDFKKPTTYPTRRWRNGEQNPRW